MIQLHTLSDNSRSRKGKRVGRGDASGKGKSAGRGTKGQRSRAGGRRGMLRRSFKDTVQKMKKLRGFKSHTAPLETVTLSTLERVAMPGATITPTFLRKRGVVNQPKNGVKIVASGTLTKKLVIRGCLVTKNAVEIIQSKGGSIAV